MINSIAKNIYALVLAGGRGTRLKQLTDWRAKPAGPFGGKFRIIDLPLSNCVNPEICAAVWLASDHFDYVNGATLYVDGGMMLYPEFRCTAC